MSVYQRSAVWYVSVSFGGQRVRKALGPGATRADAQELEDQIRRDFRAQRLGKAPRKLISEAITRWLDNEASALKSAGGLLDKVRRMLPHIKGRPLTDLVEVADAIKRAGRAEGLKPATINRRLAILRRVGRLAYGPWRWLDVDLAAGITILPGESKRHHYLTPAQVDALALACPNPHAADLIRLASMSGLRRGELLRLTAADVQDGCIVLDAETKNGRPRVIPLLESAAAIARRLPLPCDNYCLRKSFETARKAVGLPHIRFHDLRHTYASWLVQGGAPLVAVRDLLGHSNLSVTSRYSHLDTRHLKAAVSVLSPKRRAQRGPKQFQD